MTSVRRAVALSFLERYLLLVLAFASNILLARWLTPEEIGIYSVCLAAIGIVQVLRDFGIGNYLIQVADLDEDHVRTAFGISLLLGSSLCVLVLIATPWIAEFYQEPRMRAPLNLVALNFLVLPFCSISLALLRRDMQFQRLMLVMVSAGVIGFVVTITLALMGAGVLSMAVGSLVSNIATGMGAWLARPARQFLAPHLRRWRDVLRFGAQSSATNIVTSVAMDANDLVVGRVLGFQPVALISRAQGLVNLLNREFLGAFRNVALPAFARLHREGGDALAAHAHSAALTTAFAWAFYGLLALYPLEIMRLMYGPQWDVAATLLPWAALGGAIGSLTAFSSSYLIATGRMDLVTRVELLVQPLRLVFVIAAALICRDMLMVVLAHVASGLLALPAWALSLRKASGLPMHKAFTAQSRSLGVALLALTPALLHRAAGGQAMAGVAELGLVVLACTLSGLLGAALLHHPLAREPLYLRLCLPVWRGAARLVGRR